MAETRFGTFEQLMTDTAPEMRDIARQLRTLVLDVDPNTVEVVRLGDRAATYGIGPRKMSEGYAYVLPYIEWVNLGFYKATALPDPDDLLEGTGAKMRHVRVRSIDDAEDPAVHALIVAAVDERRTALGR